MVSLSMGTPTPLFKETIEEVCGHHSGGYSLINIIRAVTEMLVLLQCTGKVFPGCSGVLHGLCPLWDFKCLRQTWSKHVISANKPDVLRGIVYPITCLACCYFWLFEPVLWAITPALVCGPRLAHTIESLGKKPYAPLPGGKLCGWSEDGHVSVASPTL